MNQSNVLGFPEKTSDFYNVSVDLSKSSRLSNLGDSRVRNVPSASATSVLIVFMIFVFNDFGSLSESLLSVQDWIPCKLGIPVPYCCLCCDDRPVNLTIFELPTLLF